MAFFRDVLKGDNSWFGLGCFGYKSDKVLVYWVKSNQDYSLYTKNILIAKLSVSLKR